MGILPFLFPACLATEFAHVFPAHKALVRVYFPLKGPSFPFSAPFISRWPVLNLHV